MPAILQQGCMIQCPHGGMVNVVCTNMKVKVGGAFALLATDVYLVAGCPFMVGPKPQPCLTVVERIRDAARPLRITSRRPRATPGCGCLDFGSTVVRDGSRPGAATTC